MFIVSLFPPKVNTSILLIGSQHLLEMLAKCYLFKNFSLLLLLLLCVCMMCICGHVCVLVYVWRSEDDFGELVLFPPSCKFWGLNTIIRHGGQAVSRLSHLADLCSLCDLFTYLIIFIHVPTLSHHSSSDINIPSCL